MNITNEIEKLNILKANLEVDLLNSEKVILLLRIAQMSYKYIFNFKKYIFLFI